MKSTQYALDYLPRRPVASLVARVEQRNVDLVPLPRAPFVVRQLVLVWTRAHEPLDTDVVQGKPLKRIKAEAYPAFNRTKAVAGPFCSIPAPMATDSEGIRGR